MKKWFFSFMAIVGLTNVAGALDKAHLEAHVRKALSLNPKLMVTIAEPVPAGFGDLWQVGVSIDAQAFSVYVTSDETKYIWGNVFDMRIDPDQARAAAVDLKNVHEQGSAKAPVTVIEFSDFQCPYCQTAHAEIEKSLYKTYTESQVRRVYKHYPLNAHKWAEPAAVAAECAGVQNENAFWTMQDKFFSTSKDTTEQNVREKSIEFAKDLKIDQKKFIGCVDNKETLKRVQSDKEEGTRAGVSSTPSLLINGRLVRGFRNFDDVKAVIDEKLEESKKK